MGRPGVLVISHGSHSAEWVRLVDQAVNDINFITGIPIECSFLEIVGGRLIQDGIHSLEAQGVTDMIVVPLFISSGSTHIDEISYAFGVIPEPTLETGLTPFDLHARVHFCQPIDDDPDIALILYDKVKALSVDPEAEIVLLVGHGTKEKGFHAKWRKSLESLAERVKQLGGFDEVDVAMLLPDQVVRKMEWWKKHKPEHDVLVAPLFISEGYFTNKVIPERLKGYNYKYKGFSILPSPLITKWMKRQIDEMLQKLENSGKSETSNT